MLYVFGADGFLKSNYVRLALKMSKNDSIISNVRKQRRISIMKKTVHSSNQDRKKLLFISGIVVIIVVSIIIFFILGGRRGNHEIVKEGLAYLQQLEERDMAAIDENIDAIKTELNMELVENNPDAIWGGFEDAVILGDSRAVGFSYYEFVPQERVFAKSGGKITDIPEYIEQLKAMNPKEIYLCFGLNDVGIGFWPQPADYAAEVKKQVEVIKQELPSSEVCISSILLATGVGLEADPNYPRIESYNEGLQQMAAENGYRYVDNNQICTEYSNLYQQDGLHMQAEFYKYWAANMLAGVEEQ